MERRKLIIDCDPGVDDAVALFLAFAARDALDLLGITTVGGNVAAALTARNARLVREIAGRADVPVFAGCPRPMSRAPVEAGHFHGESGLGALTVHEPAAAAAAEHAVEFLVRTLREAPVGAITLAVTGPMTNVATALTIAPHLAGRLREIVVMGGARSEGGNITASAEYNIHADPHAAQLVFAAGCPVVALGLDLTHQVRSIPRRIEAILPGVCDTRTPEEGGNPQYWTGLRPATPTNIPFIGRTRVGKLWVNAGHGTLGWTHGAGSGKALAELISGEQPAMNFGFLGAEAVRAPRTVVAA